MVVFERELLLKLLGELGLGHGGLELQVERGLDADGLMSLSPVDPVGHRKVVHEVLLQEENSEI